VGGGGGGGGPRAGLGRGAPAPARRVPQRQSGLTSPPPAGQAPGANPRPRPPNPSGERAGGRSTGRFRRDSGKSLVSPRDSADTHVSGGLPHPGGSRSESACGWSASSRRRASMVALATTSRSDTPQARRACPGGVKAGDGGLRTAQPWLQGPHNLVLTARLASAQNTASVRVRGSAFSHGECATDCNHGQENRGGQVTGIVVERREHVRRARSAE
jgi:hypothetical protein